MDTSHHPHRADDNGEAKSTEELSFNPSLIPFNTDEDAIDLENVEFLVLPGREGKLPDASEATTWRIRVTSANPDHEPLYLELHDDIVIGRTTKTSQADLDLTKYGAARLGVSRDHAQLQPTNADLFLVDMNSTNGTYSNGVRLGSNAAHRVKDKDTLSFSGLHFLVEIISRPDPV